MPHIQKRLIWAAILMAAGVATATRPGQGPAPTQTVDRTRLDTTCSPCKDFYRFANGAWLDTVTIAPDQVEAGPLPELQRRNQIFIVAMLDSLAYAPERHARTDVERKVGLFYQACMDSTASGAGALADLQSELDHIDAIRAPGDLGRAIGRLQRHRVRALFNVGQGYDSAERVGVVAFAFFNAFSFPSLNQYLGTDSTSERVRDAFVTSVARVFEWMGDTPDTATANARRVLVFETALRRTRLIDSGVTWLSLATVGSEGPAFGWNGFASGLGKPDLQSLGVRPRTMVRAIDSLATTLPLADWKAYLRWRLVYAFAPALDPLLGPLSEFQRVATGREQAFPRRQRCAQQTTQLLGDGVARAYVNRAFSPQARAAALQMVENMRTVLRERIATLDWLAEVSRNRAIAKLDGLRLWIGYSDRLDDLSGLSVREGSRVANVLAARRYVTDRETALVGTALDRDRWIESNPTFAYGAYLSRNALEITAAQLQPPFFDPSAEPAANYGKIGQVIGHELTHAFDSNGRLYDEFGQRAEWWTPVEVQEFNRRAEAIVQQYNHYVIVDSIRQNGRATLSENISDIGGIRLAWLAFESAMQREPRRIIDDFTPEQRFFIAYAQGINTRLERVERYRTQAQVDQYSHSVARWRINGPLAHLPEFAAAFGCKRGDPMVLADSLRWTVW